MKRMMMIMLIMMTTTTKTITSKSYIFFAVFRYVLNFFNFFFIINAIIRTLQEVEKSPISYAGYMCPSRENFKSNYVCTLKLVSRSKSQGLEGGALQGG